MRRGLRLGLALALGGVAGGAAGLALPAGDGPVAPADRMERRGSLPAGDVVGRARIPTLLAWTPGGLPAGYPRAVRRLGVVEDVTAVRSGTAWLTTWRDREGDVRRAPRGLGIPLDVAAVSPSSYPRFVPPAERPMLSDLAGGGALMTRSAAALRGIGVGGRLRIGDATLRVVGILDDELVGAHEVVVSTAVGARLGIDRPRYLIVEPARGADRRRVEERLRRLLPAGVRMRIRGPGETPVFRQGDAVLPPLRLKELFGEFAAAPDPDGTLRIDPEWVARSIRTARVPVLDEVRCHRAVIPALRAALREVVRRGLADRLDPTDYGGCFAPRFINRSPGAGISHHAWGIAFDLNVSDNPLGGEPRLDPRVVEILERHGFTWGGRWLIPDGMHFEFLTETSGG